MAGTYADVPGVRIPYHVDGSLVRWVSTSSNTVKTISGSWTEYSNSEVVEMNDGDLTDFSIWTGGVNQGRYMGWVFPQPVTITGHNLIMQWSASMSVGLFEYSSNTTDGTDGAWTTSASDATSTLGSTHRDITAVNWPSVKGIRLHLACGGASHWVTSKDMAFYGTWTPATLAAWHPTLDQQVPAAQLDFGDIMPGTSATKQFRIKNGRGQAANNVLVSVFGGNAQSMAGLAVSLDNTTFTSSVTIPSIAAGAISPVVYVKRTVAISEAYGNYGIACINFVAGSWT